MVIINAILEIALEGPVIALGNIVENTCVKAGVLYLATFVCRNLYKLTYDLLPVAVSEETGKTVK